MAHLDKERKLLRSLLRTVEKARAAGVDARAITISLTRVLEHQQQQTLFPDPTNEET